MSKKLSKKLRIVLLAWLLLPAGEGGPGPCWAAPPAEVATLAPRPSPRVRPLELPPPRARPAELLVAPPGDPPAVEPPPAGEVPEEPVPAPLDFAPRFQGRLDDEVLGRICRLPVRAVRPLGGGASITLKVTLEDGSPAVFKPEQLHVTRYQSEVAAYRLSRALGLGMISPSCVRALPRTLLEQGMPRYLLQRMDEEMRDNGRGEVPGAMIHWIPTLTSLRLEKKTWWQPLLRRGAPLPPDRRRRILDISTMILVDFLVLNDDRWSGGNTHESGDRMVFVDQGAGFGPDRHGARRERMLRQLHFCQRFDRQVAQALRALDVAALQADLAPLLTPPERAELSQRIGDARRHLDRLEREAPNDSLY